MQYNGRSTYTADNGCMLQADNHMTSWNVAVQPEGDAEQRRQNRSDLSEIVRKSGRRHVHILIILNNIVHLFQAAFTQPLHIHTDLFSFLSYTQTNRTYTMTTCSLFAIDFK